MDLHNFGSEMRVGGVKIAITGEGGYVHLGISGNGAARVDLPPEKIDQLILRLMMAKIAAVKD